MTEDPVARFLREIGPIEPFVPAKTVEDCPRPKRFKDVSATGAAAAKAKRKRKT